MEFQCRVIVQRRCTSCCWSVENIPLQAERRSAGREKLFAFLPESAFTFRPECCSESQRNGVRLQTGIAFAFDRIPQIAGLTAIGTSNFDDAKRVDNVFVFENILRIARGRHLITAGGRGGATQVNAETTTAFVGNYLFSGAGLWKRVCGFSSRRSIFLSSDRWRFGEGIPIKRLCIFCTSPVNSSNCLEAISCMAILSDSSGIVDTCQLSNDMIWCPHRAAILPTFPFAERQAKSFPSSSAVNGKNIMDKASELDPGRGGDVHQLQEKGRSLRRDPKTNRQCHQRNTD